MYVIKYLIIENSHLTLQIIRLWIARIEMVELYDRTAHIAEQPRQVEKANRIEKISSSLEENPILSVQQIRPIRLYV